MSWSWLSFPAFLIATLIFVGVASGQGRYELQEQGQPPLQNNITNQEKWLQPFQNDLVNREQQDFNNQKTIGSKSKSKNKAKNKQTPEVEGIKSNVKGNVSKTNSFGFYSNRYGVDKVKGVNVGPSIGVSVTGLLYNQLRDSISTSFLDGYLVKSLHNERLSGKKMRREDNSKDDIPLFGKKRHEKKPEDNILLKRKSMSRFY